MSNHWYRKFRGLVIAPIVGVLLLATVACGAAATATPVPTVAPTAAPAPVETMAEPTAMPEVMAEPAGEMMAGPKHAPVFAEYWQPDTAFYGEPVYGGTLRINYEDPLEHANTWGASTGAATRLRGATHNRIVSDSPYDNTKIIPDLPRAGPLTMTWPAPLSISTTTLPGTTASLSSVRMLVSPLRRG